MHQFYLYNIHWATYWILVNANGAHRSWRCICTCAHAIRICRGYFHNNNCAEINKKKKRVHLLKRCRASSTTKMNALEIGVKYASRSPVPRVQLAPIPLSLLLLLLLILAYLKLGNLVYDSGCWLPVWMIAFDDFKAFISTHLFWSASNEDVWRTQRKSLSISWFQNHKQLSASLLSWPRNTTCVNYGGFKHHFSMICYSFGNLIFFVSLSCQKTVPKDLYSLSLSISFEKCHNNWGKCRRGKHCKMCSLKQHKNCHMLKMGIG